MVYCIPLKKTLELGKKDVGKKAINFALVEEEIKIPFTMVITTEVFDEFVAYNQLKPEIDWFRNAKTVEEKLQGFERMETSMRNAQFPDYVVESLKECFELVSLDTNNLQNLNRKKDSFDLISLTRSPNYDDETNMLTSTYFTKETFKQFIEVIKKIYLSAFNPTATLSEDPKVAIVASRTPGINNVIEVEYDFHKKTMMNSNYLGFPDPYFSVEQDIFEVGREFLKIENKSIKNQKRVVVFNSHSNTTVINEFSENKSSQNVTDATILEASRLTKKIARLTQSNFVKTTFFNHNDEVICTNIETKDVPRQKKEFAFEEEKIEPSKDTILKPREEKINIKDLEEDYELKNLVTSIKSFMLKHKSKEMEASVPILIRSLEKKSKTPLIQSLELCKEIVSSFEEFEN